MGVGLGQQIPQPSQYPDAPEVSGSTDILKHGSEARKSGTMPYSRPESHAQFFNQRLQIVEAAPFRLVQCHCPRVNPGPNTESVSQVVCDGSKRVSWWTERVLQDGRNIGLTDTPLPAEDQLSRVGFRNMKQLGNPLGRNVVVPVPGRSGRESRYFWEQRQDARLGHLNGFPIHRVNFLSVCLVNLDRKSTRLNSSHLVISYAVFCLKKTK